MRRELLLRWLWLKKTLLLAGVLYLIVLTGCGAAAPTEKVVDAPYTKATVKMDGVAAEALWKDQAYTTISGQDGRRVLMKAAYSEKGIYLLLRWADKTEDDRAPIWEFDGQTWQKTGWQDELAMFWDVDESIDGFTDKGCEVLCHKKAGGSYLATNGRRETADTWIWTAGVSSPYNYALDGRLDDTVIKGEPQAALKQETGDPGYVVNENEQAPPQVERRPLRKLKNGLTVDSTPYPTGSQMESITSYAGFTAGAREPTVYFIGPPTGEVGDVSAKATWTKGYWTLEVTRKLDTGQAGDIEFAPAAGQSKYSVFALTVFGQDGEGANHSAYKPASVRLMPR